ncbi:hypothetical protein ABW19_dt0209187 [Dactylella cylindrospora]|nr:hypothetical protein ABW19_dt0209187 [Dactylella cylindrospora]
MVCDRSLVGDSIRTPESLYRYIWHNVDASVGRGKNDIWFATGNRTRFVRIFYHTNPDDYTGSSLENQLLRLPLREAARRLEVFIRLEGLGGRCQIYEYQILRSTFRQMHVPMFNKEPDLLQHLPKIPASSLIIDPSWQRSQLEENHYSSDSTTLVFLASRDTNPWSQKYMFKLWGGHGHPFAQSRANFAKSRMAFYDSMGNLPHVEEPVGLVYMDDQSSERRIYKDVVPMGILTKYYPSGELRVVYRSTPLKQKLRWILQIIDAVERLQDAKYGETIALNSRAIVIDDTGVGEQDGNIKFVGLSGRWGRGFYAHPEGSRSENHQVFAIGKLALEIMREESPSSSVYLRDHVDKGDNRTSVSRQLVLRKVMKDFPGFIGELIWLCSGKLDATMEEVKELRAKYRL